MSLKFRYENSASAYYDLQEAAQQYETSSAQRWLQLAGGAPFFVAILAGGVIAMAQNASASVTASYCVAGAVFGYFIASMVSQPAARRAVRLRPSVRAAEGKHIEVELQDDALVLLCDGTTETIPWPSIRFVLETPPGFYIASGAGAAPLAAAAFRSAGDRVVARDWIRTHLSPEARARSLFRAQ